LLPLPVAEAEESFLIARKGSSTVVSGEVDQVIALFFKRGLLVAWFRLVLIGRARGESRIESVRGLLLPIAGDE